MVPSSTEPGFVQGYTLSCKLKVLAKQANLKKKKKKKTDGKRKKKQQYSCEICLSVSVNYVSFFINKSGVSPTHLRRIGRHLAGYLRSSVTALRCWIIVSVLSGNTSTVCYVQLWLAGHSLIVTLTAQLSACHLGLPFHTTSVHLFQTSACSPALPLVHSVPASVSILTYLAQDCSKRVANSLFPVQRAFSFQCYVYHFVLTVNKPAFTATVSEWSATRVH